MSNTGNQPPLTFTTIPGTEPPSKMENFINATMKFMGDKARAKAKEKSTLMQSMANNNRLGPAKDGEAGSFEYGDQNLKVLDNVNTGADRLNNMKADNYIQDQILSQYNESYIKSYQAGLNKQQAEEIANQTLIQAGSAYGVDISGLLPQSSAPEKKNFPALNAKVDMNNPLRALPWVTGNDPDKYLQQGEPGFKGKITKDSMKTKKTPQSQPTVQPTTQQQVENFKPHVQAITKRAPQNPGTDVEGLIRAIRAHKKKGVSKDMIIKELGSFVTNANVFYEEAIK